MAASLTVGDMDHLDQDSTSAFFQMDSCVSGAGTAHEGWRDKDPVGGHSRGATIGPPPPAQAAREGRATSQGSSQPQMGLLLFVFLFKK